VEVEEAALFEPNVPNFIGGVAGFVTWPARRVLLRKIGDITVPCLLAVTALEIYAVRAHLRIHGFRLSEPIVRWRRDDALVEAVPEATWSGRPPPWTAIRITGVAGHPIAELKPTVITPSTRALLSVLIGDERPHT
jgi:hypothetical protein